MHASQLPQDIQLPIHPLRGQRLVHRDDTSIYCFHPPLSQFCSMNSA